MKAKEITLGVVYAYRASKYEEPRPIVFLAPVDRDHLYIKSRTHGRAFLKAPDGSSPQAGTVYNSGTIGYPAALGAPDSDLDDLRAVTLERFERVTSTLGRRCEYTLVTALARVIGPWAPGTPEEVA
ncbi:hypothetical protein [Planobispora rosea]|uniref:hypothetical protein n=1 Tax=Planobispora rosea TaxID=35762 RepID=UPI00083AB832|nr:hypothetical protein [Planobispora rosea]